MSVEPPEWVLLPERARVPGPDFTKAIMPELLSASDPPKADAPELNEDVSVVVPAAAAVVIVAPAEPERVPTVTE